ncbi:unnamed protein product, partial [Ranitomeya imitator]
GYDCNSEPHLGYTCYRDWVYCTDVNAWVEWMRYNAQQQNRTNCYLCAAARPYLGSVPLLIPELEEECVLALFTNTSTNNTQCGRWRDKYPVLDKTLSFGRSIIYPGNYTCMQVQGEGRYLGNFSKGFCHNYSSATPEKLTQRVFPVADILWICGDMKIRSKLEGPPLTNQKQPQRMRRGFAPKESFDPHEYIDAIGVPGGVPGKFKARDQVKEGFESLIPIVTVNKNVGWINYIYYNQQRFINYSKDVLKGIAEQLEATSTMAFQSRMALGMLLAEKGGFNALLMSVASLLANIRNSHLSHKKLESLSEEHKKKSGIDDAWDTWFGWMTGWQKWLAQIGIIIRVILIFMAVVSCCIFPCVKQMVTRSVDSLIPTLAFQEDGDGHDSTIKPLKTNLIY